VYYKAGERQGMISVPEPSGSTYKGRTLARHGLQLNLLGLCCGDAAGGLSLPSCVAVVIFKFSSGTVCWKKDAKRFSRPGDAKRHENISTAILVGIILGVDVQ